MISVKKGSIEGGVLIHLAHYFHICRRLSRDRLSVFLGIASTLESILSWLLSMLIIRSFLLVPCAVPSGL